MFNILFRPRSHLHLERALEVGRRVIPKDAVTPDRKPPDIY